MVASLESGGVFCKGIRLANPNSLRNLPGSAVVVVKLTAGATESRPTGTSEGVDVVTTQPVVLTGVGGTLVDVILTVTTSKATDTLALVISDEVQASPSIEARV